MPLDEQEGESQEDDSGIERVTKQKLLIFVRDAKRGQQTIYDAKMLHGTKRVLEEMEQMSDDIEDHTGLDAIYPRTRGLWMWEGTLVYGNGPDEPPTWEGHFRNIVPQDYKDLGI